MLDGWQTAIVPPLDPKADLHEYLRTGREVMLWKLDGLTEYDLRRPLVPTGTNLLGLVRHVASIETGYFGSVFGRPFPEALPWMEDGEPNGDMWVRAGETTQSVVDFCHRAWAHSDATIDALQLDAVGEVPWWSEGRRELSLHRALVHVVNFNDLDSVEYVAQRYPIAGLITEPILQNIGIVKPQPGYLAGLRRLADQYGFVLIFDEVKTGFRHALGGYAALSGSRPISPSMGKRSRTAIPSRPWLGAAR
jgi:hypothetical protein